MPPRSLTATLLLPAALASLVAPGGAASAAQRTATPRGDDRFLDVRLALRDRAAASGAQAARPPRAGRSIAHAARAAAARRTLTGELGRQGVVEIDPLTGTVRALQRLDGALTAPSGAAPAAVARGFAAGHAAALGLSAADVDALRVADQLRTPTGLTVVRFGQQAGGIPAFDNGLRVAVDRAGRVLSVTGAPRSDLPSDPGTPRLTAADALARLMDETGQRRAVTVTGVAADARRTTTFSTGDRAQLVLFGARAVHLAWHLTYEASSMEWFDAVVDATTGDVLYRANLVKSAVGANVFRNYPGAPRFGAQEPVDIEPFLTPGATTLSGPGVHAYADINDDNKPQLGEETAPGAYGFTPFSPSTGACTDGPQCSWDHLTPTSWQQNRNQNVTQAFWLANTFAKHLAAPPIGFDPAAGNFTGADALQLEALDGAATAADGGPNGAHVDNANMVTPARGRPPRMQMYLFFKGTGSPFRDVNGGDDAAVLYHEYTHGLSSRLVTNADGTEALNTPQAAAMGEGWSDWYAQDMIVGEGRVDDTAAPGEIDMGRYTDSVPHSLRYEPLDCPVGTTDAACPGGRGTPPGGFTFAEFGKVDGAPEVHADGEIWAQTLWDLRRALIAHFGSDALGSAAAEAIITDAMRLSVPEPSFLDMRNAMLAAARNDYPNEPIQDLLWQVFSTRGMGFYAAATDAGDTAPVADFSRPPAAGALTGTLAGTIISANSGLPLAGAVAGVSGLQSGGFSTRLTGTADAGGHYAIGGVPQGSYPRFAVRSSAGYDPLFQPVSVAGGQTTTTDARLQRDWAARDGGGAVATTNDDTGKDFGCGAGALIDQSQGVGWSAENHRHDAGNPVPTATIQLPQAITVERFGLDPSNTCGDGASATTNAYKIETSPDNVTWTTAASGAFRVADRGRLNMVTPSAGRSDVRYVRLTLLSPQPAASPAAEAAFIDFSELEVYGNPPNVLPSGTLTATPARALPGRAVAFDASSFSDPDSAITGYAWDFDGDGSVDRTTATPTTDYAYNTPGAFTPRVAVADFRGGEGAATTAVDVDVAAPAKRSKARPSYVLPRTGTKGRVRFRATCLDACRLDATLTVSTATRRRLHLRSRTVGRLAPRTFAGRRTLTIRLTFDARRRIARRARRVGVRLQVRGVVTGGGPRRTATRAIRLRL